MSHHERPATTVDIHNTLSQDRPFSPYPPEYTAPNLYVPRNVYGADGKPQRDSEGRPVTTPEAGWFPIGAGSKGGVEYTRVQRNEWDPRTRTFSTLTKDIPTDQLRELQKTMETVERENARHRAMGQDATALVQGDPAAVLSRTPDSVPPVDNDPQTWALTPDEHAAFQQELLTTSPQEAVAAGAGIPIVEDALPLQAHEQASGSLDSIGDQIAAVSAYLDSLEARMPEADRIAAWQYATALHEYELTGALSRLSNEGRESVDAYRDTFLKLQKLREQKASTHTR